VIILKTKLKDILLCALSYILVATLASMVTILVMRQQKPNKLAELSALLQEKYIGQLDAEAMEDAAAEAMVEAMGDRWSYYMTAQENKDNKQLKTNTYVGVGITVSVREDGGIDVLKAEENSPAYEAGIRPGDVIVAVAGQDIAAMDINAVTDLIQGDAGTTVEITVLRQEEKLSFTVTRAVIDLVVAGGTMLPGNIGLVTIQNFNSKCKTQAVAAVEELCEQGAAALIFDVRNNPGGYLSELVALLDYLLPEGVLLKSVDYRGVEDVDYSGADCVEMPMAVLINSQTYSAAEFFAAALQEYDWAVLVGEATTGKGYYQQTYTLSDGSAVNVSTGKYVTASGVSLAEIGGLTPDVAVDVSDEEFWQIYAGMVKPEDDPQIQAAIKALAE
jgi:carboxyl-terminal processing protease